MDTGQVYLLLTLMNIIIVLMTVLVVLTFYHCAWGNGLSYQGHPIIVLGIDESIAHTHYLDAAIFEHPSNCGLFYQYWGSGGFPLEGNTQYLVIGSPTDLIGIIIVIIPFKNSMSIVVIGLVI